MSAKHAEVSSDEQHRPWHEAAAAAAVGFHGPDADDGDEDEDDDNSDRTTSTTGVESQREEEELILFEKPLTPSDVGKLNRLVIPKQYAERYFPAASGGGDAVLKGLHLCFEDECGKPWRFRYSYWNSSQSYVLTKGWSRYVKEKKLDAGDVVSFHRHGTDGLSIRWRRRRDAARGAPNPLAWAPSLYSPLRRAPHHPVHHPSHALVYVSADREPWRLRDHAEEEMIAVDVENPPPPANAKRLRLFGVNLDCPSEDHTPDPTDLAEPHHWGRTGAHRTQALFHDSTSSHSP
ncbi:hypothetical protein H6P81_003672 [Aristolochia fimbriata]|uniref:TF-B3 domain-containing protein n=1 Tax=Aristolochia fimbriata TaxID=158543 RepID=A0AAV7FDS3_ARIFI|nr:hypothetical protein H6P81_003672 [Aristolochia fimbriata]